MKSTEIPLRDLLVKLSRVAHNRDHISTNEFAQSITRASQTIRKNYCLTGEAFGIRPIKIGRRLLWPVRDIAQLLIGGRVK
jgi:hypothetical protein